MLHHVPKSALAILKAKEGRARGQSGPKKGDGGDAADDDEYGGRRQSFDGTPKGGEGTSVEEMVRYSLP